MSKFVQLYNMRRRTIIKKPKKFKEEIIKEPKKKIKERELSEMEAEMKEELMKFYIKAQIRIRDKIYT